jgi:hypothetical protein
MSAHAEAVRVSASRAPLYAYWHLLSLDAPTVAVVWCSAFAASAGVKLSLCVPVALGIATWMLYVADRLLDVGRAPSKNLRERHWFHARHASLLLAGLGIAALALAWIGVRELPRDILRYESFLAAAALLYFAAIHLPIAGLNVLRRIPLKEVTVAVIFSAAVTIPAWAAAPHPSHLLVAAVAFAVLCGLNCLMIEAVEESSRANGVSAMFCERSLLVLAGASVGCALSPWTAGEELPLFAVAIAGLLLFVLCRARARISPLTFRVTADAALLTPILFAPWHWLSR